ncbi:hypothetical protein [Frankia sp. Cr2]|uniref:hypothetical protein n=1 Tax=Frankia sp. Cr2 TaxID=3073932 RepID=UPI002AD3BF49|nr:hypothetical protein [Frankia sp. Cr2]
MTERTEWAQVRDRRMNEPGAQEAYQATRLAEAAVEKAHLAALHAAGRAAAREMVAEYESEHGTLPEGSRQRAREFLMEAGLRDDEPSRAAG